MTQYVYRFGAESPLKLRPDLSGLIYAGDALTMARWIIEPGTPTTPMSSHPDHEQFGIILQGEIEITIGAERHRLGPGDVYWCPKDYPHGETKVVSAEPAHILDIFHPARAEYVARAQALRAATPSTGADD